MAQTTITPVGTTAGTQSSDVVIASGASANIGIFVASGDLPADAFFDLYYKTPGAPIKLIQLSLMLPVENVLGPCTAYTIRRSVGSAGTAVGSFSDT